MAEILPMMRAMGDPTRFRLLVILDNEELSVNEMVRILGMGQSRISRHLAIMKEAGLLQQRREGTWSYYSIPADVENHEFLQAFRDSSDYKKILEGEGPRIRRIIEDRRDRTDQFYDKIAEDWGDIRAEYFGLRVRNRAIAGLIPSDWIVADIGSGTGLLLLALAPLVKKAIGIDKSEEMLRVARRNANQRGLKNIDLIHAELDSLPLKDAYLDGLTASIVLHHAADPEKAAKEWARVLKPGGKISIVELEKHQHEWLKDDMSDVWLGFDTKDLIGFFKSAGFEKVKVEPVVDELSTSDMGAHKTANVGIQLLTGVKKG
jgi:ubiquinone/menaquinone biosynthesis C-methylase UbiE